MKQRSQATGSVEASNSTYKFLPRADTISRQEIAHRKIMSPTTTSEVLWGLFCECHGAPDAAVPSQGCAKGTTTTAGVSAAVGTACRWVSSAETAPGAARECWSYWWLT